MLICTSCNIEYEEDRKFCKHCGDPLVPKVEPVRPQKKSKISDEEASEGRLICPQCKFVYEFGNSCIQCGVPLVRENAVTTGEEPGAPPRMETEEKATSQDLKDQPSRKIQFCPVCKIIYESGDSCTKCGASLVSQLPAPNKGEPKKTGKTDANGKAIPLQNMQEQLAEPPRQKFICPACKIIYERKTSCIRCREEVIPQDEYLERQKEKEKGEEKEKEKEKIDLIDIETGFNEIVSSENGRNPETSKDRRDEISRKQPPPSRPKIKEPISSPQPKKQEFSISIEDELFQDQSLEQEPDKKPSELADKKVVSPKKSQKDYRRTILEVTSITFMASAGAYFIWLIFSSIAMRPPEPKIITPRVIVKHTPSSTTAPTPPVRQENPPVSNPQGSAPSNPLTPFLTEAQEVENIKSVLENIRQANLEKDIDLFMSCYTADFKNRDEKRRSTLLNWKKYDYLNLSYQMKNPDISQGSAKARVDWTIKIYPKSGGHTMESRSTLTVLLEKEEGKWKIKELKQLK